MSDPLAENTEKNNSNCKTTTSDSEVNNSASSSPKNTTDVDDKKEKTNRKKRIDIYFTTTLVIYGGMAVIFANTNRYPIYDILIEFWPSFIGFSMVIFGVYFLLRWRISLPREKHDVVNFVDVDNKYTIMKYSQSSAEQRLVDELSNKNEKPLTSLNDHEIIEEESPNNNSKNRNDSVHLALKQTITILEQKANAADEKASLLLQRGVSYTKFGIGYYLISIILWQAMFWHYGFKKEYLYGIISCSFLFIFIEFLSAWFLKQYKNFTDNSVYLLKVKSIFDRFLIVYAIEEKENNSNEKGVINYKKSIELLSKDFIWPDVSVIESKENTFAKETMTSITELINAVKKKEDDNKG